jgi:outer membrane receptor protein involved in Fe transport
MSRIDRRARAGASAASSVFASRTSAVSLGALLLSAAAIAPAYGQIEKVIVTAERRAENLQTVPISVTALTASDLKAKQVSSFRDLQFHVPSLNFSKQQFGGAIVYVRGVNSAQGIGAGIAVTENDVFIEDPPLNTGVYFDLDRIETLRGPQPTNYGRGSDGGALNVHTAKPDLDNFSGYASLDLGTFQTIKPEAEINIPIVDGEFAVRLAALGNFHDGYSRNLYTSLGFPQVFPGKAPDSHINSNGTVAGRASARWAIDQDTSLDVMVEATYKNDTSVQGDKQMCHRDPSGVLGCLPDRLGFDPVNNYATFSGLLSSVQNLGGGGFMALTDVTVPNGPGSGAGNGLPGGLGALGVVIPHDLLTVVTPYNPKYRYNSFVFTQNFRTKITDWLGMTFDGGYEGVYQNQFQGFEQENPENLAPQIQNAVFAYNFVAGLGLLGPSAVNTAPYNNAYFGTPAFPNPGAAAFVPAMSTHPVFGLLPLSNTYYNGAFGSYAGIIAANPAGGSLAGKNSSILTYSPYSLFYNQDNFSLREWTGEVRFQSDFQGPFNFSTGAFFMAVNFRNQYWISGTTQDYAATALGILLGNTVTGTNGLVGSLPTISAEFRNFSVMSQSGFFEGVYEITDDLKFTAGARYTNDRTRQEALSTSGLGYLSQGTNCVLPAAGAVPPFTPGTTSCAVTATPIGTQTIPLVFSPEPFTSLTAAGLPPRNRVATWQWTGRAVLTWTPKLDFTDQTTVYGLVSRGFGYSGFNGTTVTPPPGTPVIYKSPEVLSFELGTKNTLLDGTLQANLDIWYYNWQNYSAGGANYATAAVQPVPARLWGVEGEFIWQPTDKLAFNLSVDTNQNRVGDYFLADPRNLSAGVPSGILIKDVANGANCLVQRTTAPAGSTPASTGVPGYFTPGGGAAQDAVFGVPFVNFGTCGATPADEAALQARGFTYSPQANPLNGAPTAVFNGAGVVSSRGVAGASLRGNMLPQIPFAQLSVGGQYTFMLGQGFTLVPRVDFYWQSHTELSIYSDPNIDRINSWDVMNAQIQLNAPNQDWYARVFATNIFDKRNPTGAYIAPAGNGLFTNLFVEDPRVVGISFGTSW